VYAALDGHGAFVEGVINLNITMVRTPLGIKKETEG
jgi:hypothetical protein